MLEILVNNIPLVLDPKIKIRYELQSTYFVSDGIPTGVVWHFDVPAEGNEQVLGYGNYLDVKTKEQLYTCEIKLHGYNIGNGKLSVSKTLSSKFRVSIVLNSFGVDFEGFKLNEAPYELEEIGIKSTMILHYTAVNEGSIARDYRFPSVYAPNFFGQNQEKEGKLNYVKEYYHNYKHYINALYGFRNEFHEGLVPCPILRKCLIKVMAQKGYSLNGGLFDSEFFRNLLLFSNTTTLSNKISTSSRLIANVDADFSIKVKNKSLVSFDRLVQGDEALFDGQIYTAPEDGVYNINLRLFAYSSTRHHPGEKSFDTMYGYTIRPISGSSRKGYAYIMKNGVTTDLSDFRLAVYGKAPPFGDTEGFIIKDNITLKKGDKLSVKIDIGDLYVLANSILEIQSPMEDKNTENHVIDLKENLPPILLTTIVNELRSVFFSALFFDDRKKQISAEYLKDIVANENSIDLSKHTVKDNFEKHDTAEEKIYAFAWSSVNELNDKPESIISSYDGKMMYLFKPSKNLYIKSVISNNIYVFDKFEPYNYNGDKVWEWRFYKHDFKPYGAQENTKALMMAPLPTVDNTTLPRGFKKEELYPYFSGQGNDFRITDITKIEGLLLMNWYGIIKDTPTALSTSVNINGDKLGDTSISFNGPANIIDTYGAEWLDFIQNSEDYSIDLCDVDLWKLIEIRSLFMPTTGDRHPRWVYHNGIRALPNKFTAVMDINGNISNCKFELVKRK